MSWAFDRANGPWLCCAGDCRDTEAYLVRGPPYPLDTAWCGEARCRRHWPLLVRLRLVRPRVLHDPSAVQAKPERGA